jgi:hypothetical protein
VAIRPKKLQGISTDAFEAEEFETAWADLLDRAEDPPERVRFTLAGGAGACAAQHVEGQVELFTVREAEREFRANHGGVFEAHHAG